MRGVTAPQPQVNLFDRSDQSLSVRIARASFGLTMTTVVLLSAVFMALTVADIRSGIQRVNDSAARALSESIAADINVMLADLGVLGSGSTVRSQLGESAPNHAPLQTLLETRRRLTGETGLVAVDAQGLVRGGAFPDGIDPQALNRLAMTAMQRRGLHQAVVESPTQALLLAAEPVLSSDDREVIGALMNGIDLKGAFRRRADVLSPDLGAQLRWAQRTLAEQGRAESRHAMHAEQSLALLKPLDSGPLVVQIYCAVNPWLAPVLTRLIGVAVLASVLGLMAWTLARRFGRRATARLHALAKHCQAGTIAVLPDDPRPDEIGVLSRALAAALRSYNEINERLEERVAERTEQLIASEQRLRSAIDAVDEGFAIFDPQERLVYCNREYRAGYASMADLLSPGIRFGDLIHEWVRRNRLEFSDAENAAWEARRLETFRKGGSWTGYQEDSGRWLQGIERRTSGGYIVSCRIDITQLVEARERAEAASEAKTRFLATMSHELRTPLNGVLGMAQLLQAPDISEAERLEFAQIIQQSGESLLNVLNDILDLSKIEAGKMELRWSACDPGQLLRDVALLFRKQAQAKGLELSARWMGDANLRYRLDPQRLRQLLINLVGNAIKFTETGRIDISGRELPPDASDWAAALSEEVVLEFQVRDTGIGIPRAKLDVLFQPFSQVDNSDTRRHGGTGLGLSIVKRLAELMGGQVGVQSEAGVGSQFWVRIRSQILSDLTGAAVADVRSRAASAQPIQARRVLVVEDHPINQTLTQVMLDKLGVDSAVASDGREALDLLAQGERFSLVLMDLQMPVLDGLQTTREIRRIEAEHPGQERLPVIALTANMQEGVRESCQAAGIDEVLHKPLELDGLREALDRWLPRQQASSP